MDFGTKYRYLDRAKMPKIDIWHKEFTESLEANTRVNVALCLFSAKIDFGGGSDLSSLGGHTLSLPPLHFAWQAKR